MPDTDLLAAYARRLGLVPAANAPLAMPVVRQTSKPPLLRRWRTAGMLSFLLFVVAPVFLVASYLWLIAADRFESEARFVLRTPTLNVAIGQASNLLNPSGAARATEEAYVVRRFLESRDAVDWLSKHADLGAALSVPRYDILWRFPNPFTSTTQEGLYRHYLRMMAVNIDSTTGVGTLTMQAFSSGDAQRLAEALLNAAEALVNRLNERARRDRIGLAEAEVDRSLKRALASQGAVTAFREREQLIDPTQATVAVLETIAQLSLDASQLNIQLNELQKVSPQSRQIGPLSARRSAVEAQIDVERRRLSGDAQSIAPRIAEYERLMLERGFAERMLVAAMTAVEIARVEAHSHQVYLERVATPSRPDYPAYPWRYVWILTVAIVGCLVFWLWRVLVDDALNHTKA